MGVCSLRILWLLVVAVSLARTGQALTRCSASALASDGTILVNAGGVQGTLLWGSEAGLETNLFANGAACVVNGAARKCQVGPPGTAEQITPPDLCRIYLDDGVSAPCSTFVRGCTPGARQAQTGPTGAAGPAGAVGPAGPTGPTGPTAAAPLLTYVTCTGSTVSGTTASSCQATCPMGAKIVGGVCGNNTSSPQFAQGLIADPGTQTVWSCTVRNQNSVSSSIAALGTAICMTQ